MQKLILLTIGAILFFGCKSINNLEPNQTNTFLKFYGETDLTYAKDIYVVEDGYLILGTYGNNTLLLKTDYNGNKIWAQAYENFSGNALAQYVSQSEVSYFMIGNGINADTTTGMKLIKTDQSGNRIDTTYLIQSDKISGIGVTATSSDEIVALCQKSYSDSYKTVGLMGYHTNLDSAWQSYREFGSTNAVRTPYRSIYENGNAEVTWLSSEYYTPATQYLVQATFNPTDSDSPNDNPTLFEGQTLTQTIGAFVKTPIGYAATQPVISGGSTKIGVSVFDRIVLNEYVLDEFNGNYVPKSIANTNNGLLVVGTTDQYQDSGTSPRTDVDLFVTEVGYDGQPKANGINNSFGGLGNEVPVKVVNAPDGGYLVLGNLTNTKGAVQIFLLKINSAGALN